MPDLSDDAGQMRNQLQLTVLSAEILKRELDKVHDISLSCNISELPNYHCNLVFQQKQQDIGPIGFLQFDAKRPLVNAVINLGEQNFSDFFGDAFSFNLIFVNLLLENFFIFHSLAK